MIDKVIISSDGKRATIIFDHKNFNLYHSESKVIDLVNEFIFEPMDRLARREEVTEVIEIQLSLFKEVV